MNWRISTMYNGTLSKLKKIDLMDIIKSIIIPIIVAYGVVDYQINHQTILEKQDAAKQMLIEINSTNDNLQKYADMYNRNLDLFDGIGNPQTVPGKNNTFIIYDKYKRFSEVI